MKKTKIIATIGPASANEAVLKELFLAGVDYLRFNLKHNTIEWHQTIIKMAEKVANENNKAMGIIVDIPKIEMATAIKNADFVALSYLKSEMEIVELKKRLSDAGIRSKVIAKIESSEALGRLVEITKVADAIMVARGDLGKTVPLEQLAFWQKKIIEICRVEHVPVIVATQMLLSMTDSQTPTRAEATDVANAVFDGADALMLSEESAIGNYPAESAKFLIKIAVFGEDKGMTKAINDQGDNSLLSAVVMMAQKNKPKIDGIVALTQSGHTARYLSSFHLPCPIVAVTSSEEVLGSLQLNYGVFPYIKVFKEQFFDINHPIFEEIKKSGLISKGQWLVIHGTNWIHQGSSNTISLLTIND